MDIVQSDNSEGGQHQDSDAGSEIPSVNRDAQLEHNRSDHSGLCRRQIKRGFEVYLAPEKTLNEEKARREKNQKRNQLGEHRIAGLGKQDAPDQPSNDAYGEETTHPRFDSMNVPPIPKDTPDRSDKQCDRAGGIGDDGRGPKEQQRRKREQRASAGDSVDKSSSDSRSAQTQDFSN